MSESFTNLSSPCGSSSSFTSSSSSCGLFSSESTPTPTPKPANTSDGSQPESTHDLRSIVDEEEMLNLLFKGIKMHMSSFCSIAFDKEGNYRPGMMKVIGQSEMRCEGFTCLLQSSNDSAFEIRLNDFMEGVERVSDFKIQMFVYFAIQNYKAGEKTFYCNCPRSGYMFGDIGDAKYPAVQIMTRVLESLKKKSLKLPHIPVDVLLKESDYEIYKLYIVAGFDPTLHPFESLYYPWCEQILIHNLSLGIDPDARDLKGLTALARFCKELTSHSSTRSISILLESGAKTTDVDKKGHNAYYYLNMPKKDPYVTYDGGVYVTYHGGKIGQVRKILDNAGGVKV